MKHTVQLKTAKTLQVGDYLLKPQHPNGIVLARKITATRVIDNGKGRKVEIETLDGILHVLSDDKNFHVLSTEDVVVVVC